MTKEAFMELHGLDPVSYQMVGESSLEAIQCILISEHNEVVFEHEPLTPKGVVQYCRAQVWVACAKEDIPFPPKLEHIPESARANIEVLTKMDRSTYFKRMKIALLPNDAWLKLVEIWDQAEHYELAGQTEKGKNKKAELPIRLIEHLVSKLDPGEVTRIFDDLLEENITTKEVAGRTHLAATQKSLREVFFFYVRFDPKKEKMDAAHDNQDQLFQAFIESGSSYNTLVSTLMEAGNRKKVKLLKLPWGQDKSDRFGTNSWFKETAKKYNQLPAIVQSWIQSGRSYFFRKMQPDEQPQALPGNMNTVIIKTSKNGFAPMKFTFLQQDLCDKDSGSSLATLDPTDREYEAAHLQLPMGGKADKLLDIAQIQMVIQTITTMCTAPSLVLQLWCHSTQHAKCKEILEETFDTVDVNIWQKPLSGHSVLKTATGFVPDDLLFGFIASKKFNPDGPPIYVKMCPRPNVVFAPAVKKLTVATIEEQQVTCNTEMNPLVPKQFYDKYSRQDRLVADFMCGSGSAAVAAASLGRSCLVVGLDKNMVFIFFLN